MFQLPNPLRFTGWVLVLLLSAAMWLGISSIYDNLGYQLLKFGYQSSHFGRVSVRTLAICEVWVLGFTLLHWKATNARSLTRLPLIVLASILLVALLTAIDIFSMVLFARIGLWSHFFWLLLPKTVLEMGLMIWIVATRVELLPYRGIERAVFIVAEAFTILVGAKALLLLLIPGVDVKV